MRAILPIATFLLLAAGCGSGGSGDLPPTGPAILACDSATTLEELVACIRKQMPLADSDSYAVPGATEVANWRTVIARMLGGECGFALPASLADAFRVRTFADAGNGRNYCVLMEVRDADRDGVVDLGWGTFIVHGGATRELSHQAPHPIADSTTESQAVTLFKQTDARTYLMAGAHRNASRAASSCQGTFRESDVAHDTGTMFHAANRQLVTFYGATLWHALQWHGMAEATCPSTEVYLSHGRNVAPGAAEKIAVLRDELVARNPGWDVHVPGSGVCNLDGTQNVQGRLINGVAAGSECVTAASSHSGRFVHIEQDPNFRNPADWLPSLLATWP